MSRVLVLRAREDAARTAETLRAMGHEPVLSPVLEIAPTGAAIPPGPYDAVLASSAKGLECAGADAHAFQSLPFHAVGAKTAAAARGLGWRPDIVAGAAESILPLLLGRYTYPVNFLYIAGRDRQPTLEAGLRGAGHRITTVTVYEARAAEALTESARAAIEAGSIAVALHYSRRSVDIFLRLVDAAGLAQHLRTMRHAALSNEVAAPLRAVGLSPVVAEKPDEAGLLEAAKCALA
ncbi:uroporphyrinogen-III synthase [Methylocystis echinoides]|uniref:Uroporphyrinogen III methyltransferase n=1 Tax=Methylocystis echinoides TaxID=29468 RepID=A0A9W6GUJ5_9HYPH|nr:uroporphyrinogen-III synthase [Methylocystis echinoides]GLI93326.1 uroporphyrinogen III methyltransferase [Methylocystis echinoides]